MRRNVDAVIACAMHEELLPFLEAAEDLEPALPPLGGGNIQQFQAARLGGRSVVLIQSGIGLVNAASAATRVLEHFRPDLYLLGGTTGGLAANVQVGDVVAGTSALFFDGDATVFGYQLGQIPRMPAEYVSQIGERELPADHQGLVMSGNSFITSTNVAEERALYPDAVAVDMETAAAAQVCFLYDQPWLSLRAVSDLCGPEAGQEFHIEVDAAAKLSFAAAKALLEHT